MSTTSPPAVATAALKGHWLLGCLREFYKDPLGLYQRARQEHGDFVRLRLIPGIYAYLACHPDGIEHVLHKNAKNYRKPNILTNETRRLIGNGLFVSEGDFWQRQRRVMQPAFHRQNLVKLAPLMVSAAETFVEQHLAGDAPEPVDIVQEMTTLALRTISTTLFGSDVLTVDPEIPGHAVAAAFRTAFHHVTRSMRSPAMSPVWFPTPANLAFARARKLLDRAVSKLIEVRRHSPSPRTDILSLLLAAQKDEIGMSDQQVKDEVLTMLTAGHETTASALSWAWYLLGCHPQIQENLADEVRGRVGGNDASLTVDDLPHLPLARAVFEEGMRLYPPAWGAPREALQPDTIGGHAVPARGVVIVTQWVTHRHPDFWPQPEQFRPERFMPGQDANRHPYAYFPFGAGPRGCIGGSFAMMNGPLVLAAIARRFHVELLPGQTVVPDPTFTLRPRDPIQVFLRPR